MKATVATENKMYQIFKKNVSEEVFGGFPTEEEFEKLFSPMFAAVSKMCEGVQEGVFTKDLAAAFDWVCRCHPTKTFDELYIDVCIEILDEYRKK